MKLAVSENVLETNLTESYELTIGQDEAPIIMSFLRDTIYSNPRASLVKEVLSNSLDVHKQFNVTRPVEITLPGTWSSELIIRDFGSGLSKEFMTTKYTRAGCSTKRDSNLTTGGYGIGRLSPLAYTDIYHVHSYQEGVKYSYQIALHDDGGVKRMSLSPLEEEPTSEPNGLAVSIPIKAKDTAEFKEIVYLHCNYLHEQTPLINGIPAPTIEKDIESKDGVWYTTKGDTEYNTVTYLIGGMPNKANLETFTSFTEYTNRYLGGLNLVINVPIGSVSQTASKDIQKSNLTQSTLTNLVTRAKEELPVLLVEQTQKCTTYLEACKVVNPYPTDVRSNLKWNDLPLQTFLDTDKLKINGFKIEQGQRNKKYYKRTQGIFYTHKEVYIYDLPYKSAIELLQEYDVDQAFIITEVRDYEKIKPYKFKLLSSVMPAKLPAKYKVEKAKSTTLRKKVISTEMSCWYLRTNSDLQVTTAANKTRVPKEPEVQMFYLLKSNFDCDTSIKSFYFKRDYCNLANFYHIYIFDDLTKVEHPNWVNFEDHLKSKVKEIENNYPEVIEYTSVKNENSITRFLHHSIQIIKDAEISNFVKKLNSFESIEGRDIRFLDTYIKNYWDNEVVNNLLLAANKIAEKYPAIFGGLSFNKYEEYVKQVNFYRAAHVQQ